MFNKEELMSIFQYWKNILRIDNVWDVRLDLIDNDSFWKTGDIKIDCDDRKAIVLFNIRNPKQENFEEVIVHELLHLKFYPLDQLTEGLIDGHYEENTPEYNTIFTQFMTMLEQTVEEMTKCFLSIYGKNKNLSFGRCEQMKSFDDLYNDLKSLK